MGPNWQLRLTCHLEVRQKGGGCGARVGEGGWLVVWTSKGRKAIHIEMKKKMFSKQMFPRPSLTMKHREDFDQMGFVRFLLNTHSSYYTAVIYDDSSLCRASPLYKDS